MITPISNKLGLKACVQGFTLIEAVMVIVITGILGAMVAVFIKAPVQGYFDSERRAALTDEADTAVRRMARDLRQALPNSVRHPANGSDQCLEFIPTRIGGRYRTAVSSNGTGSPLDFTVASTTMNFDMLWLNSALPAAEQIAVGDLIVVYNDGSTSGDAYTGVNTKTVSALTQDTALNTTQIKLTSATAQQFPSESPSHRFQVIPGSEQVVGFGCSGTTLFRYSSSAMHSQPASCTALASGATATILATHVSCDSSNGHSSSFKYEDSNLQQQGLVSISLKLTDSGESVNLYHQIHVDNVP